MRKLMIAGLLGLCTSHAFAQTPLNSWSTTTQAFTTSTLSNVTAPSDAGGSLTPLTNYTVNHLVGTELILDVSSLTTSGKSYTGDSQFPDLIVLRKRDSTTPIHIWQALESAISGTTINLSPGAVADYSDILSGLTMESGMEKVFANDDDIHGNRVDTDNERLDIIWHTGLIASTPADQAFVLFDRGGDAVIQVAAITGLDANGDPSSFGSLLSVASTDWSSTSTLDVDALISRKINGDDDPKPKLDLSTEGVEGLVISFSDLGLTTNEIVYGYAIFPPDVSAASHTLTDISTYPTNTLSSACKYDPVAGGFLAKSVAANDLFTAEGPGGYLPGMVTWLRADAGVTANGSNVVSAWEDQSPGNYDFSPFTGAPTYVQTGNNLINNNKTLLFDSDGLTTANNVDYNTRVSGYTRKGIYAALRTGSDVSTRQMIYEQGGATNGLNFYIENGAIYASVWNKGSNGSGAPFNDSGTYPNFISGSVSANTDYLISYEFEGSTAIDGELKLYLNGELQATLPSMGILYSHAVLGLGQANGGSNYHKNGSTTSHLDNAYLSEFIYRNNPDDLTTAERQRLESYLALKYGITLDQTLPTDYYDSDGTVVFDATNPAATGGYLEYNQDIAGLARDDQSTLLQSNSKSVNAGTILSMAASGSIVNDNSWLMWGHDGGALTTTALTNTPINAENRLTRIWRVAETGELGNVEVSFDLSGLGLSTDEATYGLMIADVYSGGSFTNPDRMEIGATFNGDVLTFSNVNLENGEYFTLATDAQTTNPVPFHTGLAFWLKADAGVSPGTDATAISQWNDQGIAGNHAIDASGLTDPVYRSSGSLINGYPVIDFSGATNTGFAIANDDLINTTSSTQKTFGLVFRTGTDVTTQQLLYEQGGASTGMHIYIEDGEVRSAFYNTGGTNWNLSPTTYIEATVEASTTYLYLLRFDVPDLAAPAADRKVTAALNNVTSLTEITGVTTLTSHTGAVGIGVVRANTKDLSPTGFTGQLAEIIQLDDHSLLVAENNIAGIEVQDPESWISDYLGLKYGFWSSGDIYLSNGITRIFNSADFTYDNGGIAIVRDDAWGLLSKQVSSQASDNILSMGLGGVATSQAANTGSFTEDQSAIVITHNQGSTAQSAALTTDLPTGYQARMNRVWEVKETGNVGAVSLEFDLTGLGYSPNIDNFGLILSNDATMANGTVTTATSYDAANHILTFDNIDFSSVSRQFMGLAVAAGSQSPGGVYNNLYTWLRADAGTSTSTDNSTLSTWGDQSIYGTDATSDGNPPLFKNNATDNINYNPVIDFDGTDDRLTLGNLANIKSGSANGGDYTIVGIGLRADQQANYFLGSEGGTDGEDIFMGYAVDGNGKGVRIGHLGADLDMSSAKAYDDPGLSPFLLFGNFDAGNRILEETRDGSYLRGTQTGLSALQGSRINYVGKTGSFYFNGPIAELIIYENAISEAEEQQLNSYLALKYGLTLTSDNDDDATLGETIAGAITEGDYVSADGTVVWDYSANSGYHNEVAGIGRDDVSGLNQKQGGSQHFGGIVSAGLGSMAGTNTANTSTFDDNGDFLIWGHNDGDASLVGATDSDLPSGINLRMSRVWKVQNTGATGAVELQFDLTGLGYTTDVNNFQLIVSNSASMAGGSTTAAASYDTNNNILSFTGVTLTDGQYFTIGLTDLPGPGGVSTDLYVWLRADAGTSTSTDNTTLATWGDQAAPANDATDNGNPPLFKNNTTDNINYNPVIDFDGTDDYLELGNLANIKSGSTDGGNQTIFGVGIRNDSDFNFIIGSVTTSVSDRLIFGYRPSPDRATLQLGNNSENITVSSYDSPQTPYLLEGKFDISSGITIEETRETSFSRTAGSGTIPSTGSATNYLGMNENTRYYNGLISEVIIFNNAISELESQQVNSYLALKYGLTLTNDNDDDANLGETIAGAINEGDYASASGVVIWDYNQNSAYHNGIAGIGRDDASLLDQKQSISTHADAVLAVGLGSMATTNTANANAFDDDGDFLIWGHDGGTTARASANSTDLPEGVSERMSRVWKVADTGTVGATEVQFHLSGLGYGTDAANFHLIVSNSATMADGSIIAASAYDLGTDIVSFTGVDLTDGQYLSLGTTASAPGGVSTNLYVWLKADAGTSTTTDNSTLSTWTGQGVTSISATADGNPPLFKDNATDNINFNPVIDFDGTNDRLTLGNLANIKSGSANGGDYTIVGVGLRADEQADYFLGSAGTSNGQNLLMGYALDGNGKGVRLGHSGDELDMPSAKAYDDPGLSPFLLFGNFDAGNRILEETRDGSYLRGTQTGLTALQGSMVNYIGMYSTIYYNGPIAELIIYEEAISEAEEQQVNSYLALKYGLTLTNDNDDDASLGETIAGAITEGDYVSADGTVVWDYSANSSYHNEVAGIGRDDASGLNQKQGGSQHDGSIVSMALGSMATTNTANANAFDDNGDLLIWGHDGGNADNVSSTSSDVPNGVIRRMNRKYKVQNTGSVGAVELQFNLSGLGYGTVASQFKLIVSNTSSLSAGTLIAASSYDTSTDVLSFSGLTLTDGQYFGLGTISNGPGGDYSFIYMWLKADAGTSTSTDNTTISTWSNNVQGATINATADGNPPLFKNNATDNINFNPVIDFDGTDDRLLLGNLADIKVGSTNGGEYTIVGVGIREDAANNYFLGSEGGTDNEGLYMGYNTSAATIDHWGRAHDLNNTTAYNSPALTPFILYGNYNDGNNIRVLEETRDGSLDRRQQTGVIETTGTENSFVGALTSTGDYFNGRLAELIIYSRRKDASEEQHIMSYLALKYGISLTNDNDADGNLGENISGFTEGDYIRADDGVIWDYSANSTYHNDIAGIGRDDDAALSQKQSKSQHDGSILTIGLGSLATTNADNTNDFDDDEDFLVWGHDATAAGIASSNGTDVPVGVTRRMGRVWKVQNTGSVGAVEIQFALAGLGYGSNLSEFNLIVSGSSTMASGSITAATAYDAVNNTVSFTGVTLGDGQFFTLGTSTLSGAPGGISTNLYAWYKADQGPSTNVDGAYVSTWVDKSASGLNATALNATDVKYQNNSSNNINFNPTLESTNGDGMSIGNLANIKAGSANGGHYSLIGIVQRDGEDESVLLGANGISANQDLYWGHLYTNGRARLNHPSGTASPGSGQGFDNPLESPSLLYGAFDGSNLLIEETRDGNYYRGTQSGVSAVTGSGNNALFIYDDGQWSGLLGLCPEIIIYQDDLSAADEQKVSTYMALKYGLTLSNDNDDDAVLGEILSGAITEGDYVSATDVVIWDYSANSAYHHEVAGIGRDDASVLSQKQSRSEHSSTVVLSMGLGNIVTTQSANTNEFSQDGSFLIWGHNDAAINQAGANTTDLPEGVFERMSRIWKVQETGTVGDTEIQFDLTGLGYGTEVIDFKLIVSNSATMANGSLIAASAYDAGTQVVSFTGIDLTDGQYISLATSTGSPGGIATNLYVWLKADEGTSTTTDNTSLSTWSNNANGGPDATTDGNPPLFKDNATDNINFNPVIAFDGTDDRLALGNLANIKSGSANGGNYTLFGVGIRNDDNDNYIIGTAGGTNNESLHFGYKGNISEATLAHFGNDVSVSVTTYDNPQTPYLLAGSFNTSSGKTLEETRSGSFSRNTQANTTPLSGSDINYIASIQSLYYNGLISEVIIFEDDISEQQEQQVNSYLALKYGLTLTNDNDDDTSLGETIAGSVTEGDYVSGAGTIIWDYSANSGYHNGIAGIGLDNISHLDQKQGGSTHFGAVLSMALGNMATTNSANTSEFSSSDNFLLWGHDNGTVARATANFTDLPSGVYQRMSRVWKVQETGTVGATEIQFNLSGLGYGTKASDFKLIVSNSATMASGTTIDAASYNASTGVVSFTGVDLTDGQYITLSDNSVAPGGVAGNLYVWLRADAGTSTTTDNTSLSTWSGQGATSINATDVGNPPLFKNNTTDNINYNPVIDFDGSNDHLELGNLANIKSGSTNGGNHSVFGVGLRNSNSINFILGSVTTNNSDMYIFGYRGGSGTNATLKTGTNTFNLSVPNYTSPQTPYLLQGQFDSSSGGTLEETRGTSFSRNTSGDTTPTTGSTTNYLGMHQNQRYYNGPISEVIIFDNAISELESQKVNSYLALKYGFTLTNDNDDDASLGETIDGSITEGDYLSSGEVVVWDYSANSAYHYGIAGIGRDDVSALYQKQSGSTHVDGVLSIGLGSVAATGSANANVIDDHGTFMIWGHNNGATAQSATNLSDVPSGIFARMSRLWKVQKTGTLGATELNFDLTDLGYSTDVNDLKLIVANSATMSSGTTIDAASYNAVTNVVSFTNVDLTDGQYFTLGALGAEITGPGGVDANLKLWLRADAEVYNTGTTAATNGQTIATWNDQSSRAAHATDPGSLTTFSSSNVNFNPSVEFSNDATSLEGSFTTTSAGLTQFAVGYRSAASSDTDALYELNSGASNHAFRGSSYGGGAAFGTNLSEDAWSIWRVDHPSGTLADIYENGALLNGAYTTANTGTAGTFNYTLGDDDDGGNDMEGFIGEVITYQSTLTELEALQVESYLALKYGIHLSADRDGDASLGELISGSITEGDFVNSSAEVVWDYSVHSAYHNGVAGIGHDSEGILYQKQSQSAEADAIMSVSLGTEATSNADNANSLDAGTFIIWGHNGGSTAPASMDESDVPSNVYKRLARIWKVQVTGTSPTNLEVSFDLTGLGHNEDNRFRLLESSTTSFSNATELGRSLVSGSSISFSDITLKDGYYYTISEPFTPGGIGIYPSVWLSAEDEEGFINGGDTKLIRDQSSYERNAIPTRLGTGSNANVVVLTDASGNYNEFENTNSSDAEYLKTENGNDISDDFTLFSMFRTLQIEGSTTNFEEAPALFSAGTDGSNDDYGLGFAEGRLHLNADNTNGLTLRSPAGTTYNDNQWHIAAGVRQRSAASGSVKLYANGLEVASGTSVDAALDAPTAFGIGNHASPTVNGQLNGDIREVIAFPSALSQIQIEQISTYLALKYHFTLQSDYRDSNGNVVWDYSLTTNHNYNITGIFNDHASTLSETNNQGIYQNPTTGDFTAEEGEGILYLNSSSVNDGDYFLIGDTNAAWADGSSGSSRDTDFIESRLKRQWLVQTNNNNTVDLIFLLPSTYFQSSLVLDPTLMIDDDGNFDTGTSYVSATSFGGGHTMLVDGETIGAHEFRFEGVSLTNGQFFTMGSSAQGVLPVNFLSIDATRTESGNARVSWTSSDNQNGEMHILQRSSDHVSFRDISHQQVSEANQRAGIISMEYLDDQVGQNRTYYRVRHINGGGHETYSEIVSLAPFEKEETLSLTLFPNPSRGEAVAVRYRMPAGATSGELILFNSQGLLLQKHRLGHTEGELSIDLNNLTSGIYLVKVYTNEHTITKRLLISK